MNDIGRCPRCHKFLIAEQLETHKCEIPFKHVKEIYVDWITNCDKDVNDDIVYVAMGLDGNLYRLIHCKHNPPHNVVSRWLTRKDMSHEDNST